MSRGDEKTPSENPATKYLDRLFEKRFGPLEREVRESARAVLAGVQAAVALMAEIKAMQVLYEQRTQRLEERASNLEARVSMVEDRLDTWIGQRPTDPPASGGAQ